MNAYIVYSSYYLDYKQSILICCFTNLYNSHKFDSIGFRLILKK